MSIRAADPSREGYSAVTARAARRRHRARTSWVRGRVFVQETGVHNGAFGADKFGFKKLKGVNWNFGAPQLYEHSLKHGEAVVSADGALCADTGALTGRSAKAKFQEPVSRT